MGRKRKNQTYSFPSAAEAVTAPLSSTTEDLQKKSEIKKANDNVPEIFAPEQVAWVFDVYAIILSFGFSIILKTDFKPIHEELKFEEKEKESLAKPLARICSKYCPAEWAGLQAEFELIGSIGMYTVMKFRIAQGIAEKEKERKKKEGPRAVPPIQKRPAPAAPPIPEHEEFIEEFPLG